MDGGFPALQEIGAFLEIYGNDALTSLGDSFSVLREIGGHLEIYRNHQLTSLGTAFRSLDRVVGVVRIHENPSLHDFENLRNLSSSLPCHRSSRDAHSSRRNDGRRIFCGSFFP